MDSNTTFGLNSTVSTFTEPPPSSSCIYKRNDRAPSAAEVIQQLSDIGPGAYVYMLVPVILFVVMAAIYIDEAIFIIKDTEYWQRTQQKLWILSGFPVITGLCVIGLFFPRSSATVQILISFYNAYCMKKYFDLVLHYYGGKKKMVEIANGMKIKANPFPCSMWFCIPDIKVNIHSIRVMQYLIYPVTVYQPIVFVILTVLWNEDLEDTNLSPLLTVLNLSVPLASFVAVYGFVIINKISEGPLRDYRIRGKFIAVQLVLGINTVQGITLLTMDLFQAVECGFPYQNPRPGFMIHLYIFPIELFLLSIAARYSFRISERGFEPIPVDNNNVISSEEGRAVASSTADSEDFSDSGCLSFTGKSLVICNPDHTPTKYSLRSSRSTLSASSVELKSCRRASEEHPIQLPQNGC